MAPEGEKVATKDNGKALKGRKKTTHKGIKQKPNIITVTPLCIGKSCADNHVDTFFVKGKTNSK